MDTRIPLPVEPLPHETEDKRIWIGNLDSRLTEFQLIKVLKKYGSVKKFDFLFHKAGPLKGHPRGYCFVTYETKGQAEHALSCLHGKLVFSKTLVAKWANNVPNDDLSVRRQGSGFGIIKKEQKPVLSVNSQIHAIEAKLRAMERDKERDLGHCLLATPAAPSRVVAVKPTVAQHQAKPYRQTQRMSR
ncbi:putative RNA-binding protein 18 isoform X2 [Amblyomma americanum]|uniref:Probable RNA-binding protein 18 n=1 Tax=Amblyomma americanum TaxID=6943 RepID=A0AAQ4DM99_AMBAM